MKHFLVLPITILMLLFSVSDVWANSNSSYSLNLRKVLSTDSSQNITDTPGGNRVPPRPITCSINQDSGIVIPNVDTADINSFEVYDENQMCIASFVDENDFITFIFSYTGVAEIHLNFDTYSLIGFLIL